MSGRASHVFRNHAIWMHHRDALSCSLRASGGNNRQDLMLLGFRSTSQMIVSHTGMCDTRHGQSLQAPSDITAHSTQHKPGGRWQAPDTPADPHIGILKQHLHARPGLRHVHATPATP